jgi:FAD/FMN-containing dehydrogenase
MCPPTAANDNRRVRRTFLKKVLGTALVVAAALAGFICERIVALASPPSKEKDCDFAYPPEEKPARDTLAEQQPRKQLRLDQPGGFINDASCLNKTPIYGIVKVGSIDDLWEALRYARENNLKVSVAGQRHSMGGQAFVEHGLVLDMRGLNRFTLREGSMMILNTESGATWAEIQTFLDQKGLSVKAMQSINIPTVGGTLSVNAHGIAHDPGQVAPTVRSLRIMLSDGSIKTANPTENAELFRLTLGGYGLFGVILDADLEVVPNEVYEWKTQYMGYAELPDYYHRNVEGNQNIGLAYGRLSVSPSSYLTETAFHTYEKRSFDGAIPALEPLHYDWFVRFVLNFSKTGGTGRRVRWDLEKYVEPIIYPCLSRNQAMTRGEGCLVTRNREMADSMSYLKGKLQDTDILQEYFIPRAKMAAFVDGLRNVVERIGANLLNITVRIVHRDTVTALPYAKSDMFAFVLYFNQRLNVADSRTLERTTDELIDLAIGLGGTFYLPYQLYYSREQLLAAYPEIDYVFGEKRKYDPIGLFTNKFYEKYSG